MHAGRHGDRDRVGCAGCSVARVVAGKGVEAAVWRMFTLLIAVLAVVTMLGSGRVGPEWKLLGREGRLGLAS